MNEYYDFREAEPKWQKVWADSDEFEVAASPGGKKKFYVLEMLPYPSGDIHMGHVRNYSIGDVIARYYRMKGFDVLHPIGFDSLGLPAENAAMKHGVHPREWTERNISNMTAQLKTLGFSYPWKRCVMTYKPEYYHWNQWFFIKMYEKGLVYRQEKMQNWCPECKTVLANEQVVGGYCWRHESTPAEKRKMNQWFFRITAYAEELLKDLEKLAETWPEEVLTMQRNWIGKSMGTRLNFEVEGTKDTIEVFTTRVDTIYGATFIVLSPEHPAVEKLVEGSECEQEMMEFVGKQRNRILTPEEMLEQEKEGVFTGRHAINPFNGEKMPIWVGNFVLMEFGTGAVFATPAHDQRDFEFARKYGLTIRPVIETPDGVRQVADEMSEAMVERGRLFNSGPFDGKTTAEAIAAINDDLEKQGTGGAAISYRLKDWGISRQRYWGTPIPIIYCDTCGIQMVPEDDLPVVLPDEYISEGEGSPLERVSSWLKATCPTCGSEARRETDTMDTFVDSSWYHIRYTSPTYDKGPYNPKSANYWIPVDLYIGGIEHAVLHLMYFRFFHKFQRDIGLLNSDEPTVRLFTQGMVIKDGSKMSKSKGNVVDPNELIENYGADALRLFMLFAAPPDKQIDWAGEFGIEGQGRFLQRIWKIVRESVEGGDGEFPLPAFNDLDDAGRALIRKAHQTIKKVSDDIAVRIHHNTAIAAIMELINAFGSLPRESESARAVRWHVLELVVNMIFPFAPHFGEEIWEQMGHSDRVAFCPWPEYDKELAAEEVLAIMVQVNGKLRGKVEVPAGTGEEEVKEAAQREESVARHIEGKTVRKIIYVPGKLVNIVVS